MRTLDGIHYTHVINPRLAVRLQDTPLSIDVVEGGFTVVDISTLRAKFDATDHDQPLPTLGVAYLALIDNLETWLDTWCDHCQLPGDLCPLVNGSSGFRAKKRQARGHETRETK